jgi:hypothetical protein
MAQPGQVSAKAMSSSARLGSRCGRRNPREPHGFQEPAHVQYMMEIWAAFFDEHQPR